MSTPYVCEPKSAQSQGLLSECLVDIPGRILRAGFHDDRQLGAEGKKKTGTATNSFDRIDQPILAGFHFWALCLLLGD
jgi:hypothetical protein